MDPSSLRQSPLLSELDDWYLSLSAAVPERSPPHITHAELSKMMKWKLTKGSWYVCACAGRGRMGLAGCSVGRARAFRRRPRLQQFVDAADPAAVVALSTGVCGW